MPAGAAVGSRDAAAASPDGGRTTSSLVQAKRICVSRFGSEGVARAASLCATKELKSAIAIGAAPKMLTPTTVTMKPRIVLLLLKREANLAQPSAARCRRIT